MTDAVVLASLDIFRAGLAVADMDSDILVFGGNLAHMLAHGVVDAVAGAMDKPGRPSLAGVDDGIEHADHRRQTNPAAEQNNRAFRLRIEKKIAARGSHLQAGAGFDDVMKVAGTEIVSESWGDGSFFMVIR